jgi:uncharacterized DUF497 family protein
LRYNFEWDPIKAKRNLEKHKVGFERATELFLDPSAVSVFDQQHSEAEERWITVGRDSQGRILVLVHTFSVVSREESRVRIVSARKATKRETRDYEETQR